jgi:hypothetical protein
VNAESGGDAMDDGARGDCAWQVLTLFSEGETEGARQCGGYALGCLRMVYPLCRVGLLAERATRQNSEFLKGKVCEKEMDKESE